MCFLIVFGAMSCSKDNIDSGSTDVDSKPRTSQQSLVINFLEQKASGSHLTSRSTVYNKMQMEEGVEFLEEALNMGFCRLDSNFFEHYTYAYDTIAVSVDNDSILSADLSDAFDDVAQFAANVYDTKASGSRYSVLFGINSDFEVDSLRDVINLYCLYIVGEHIGSPYQQNGNYDFDDYWHYCCGEGRCGNYSGGEPLDAAIILARDLKRELVPRLLNIQYYFINPFSICFSQGSYCDEWPDEIIYDDYIFDESGALWFNPSDCLSPEDLQYHFEQTKALILDHQPSEVKPQFNAKPVVNIKIVPGQTLSSPPTYVHGCGVTYGTLIEFPTVVPEQLELMDYK